MSAVKDSSDAFGEKLDKCVTDSIVKFGGGALLGLVSSWLFLGRRKWPVIAGAGIGIGIAYANSITRIKKLAR